MFCRTYGRWPDSAMVFPNMLNNESTFLCASLPAALDYEFMRTFKALRARAACTQRGVPVAPSRRATSQEPALRSSVEFQGPLEGWRVFSKAGDAEVSPPSPSGSPLGSVVRPITKISRRTLCVSSGCITNSSQLGRFCIFIEFRFYF